MIENNFENKKIATPLKRFISFVIDSLIILPIYFGLHFFKTNLSIEPTNESIGTLFNLLFLFFLLITWISFNGQSPGQIIMKLKIVTIDNKELTILQYVLRLIGWLASNITLGIGFLVMFFNKDYRCLHDYTSNSKVIELD